MRNEFMETVKQLSLTDLVILSAWIEDRLQTQEPEPLYPTGDQQTLRQDR